jgi:hypothetical protein
MANDPGGHLDAVAIVRNLSDGNTKRVAVLAVDALNQGAVIVALAAMVNTLAGECVDAFLDQWTSATLRALPPEFDPGDFDN